MKTIAFRTIAVAAALCWLSSPAGAQQARPAGNAESASMPTPMTADGHPDLSGVWSGGGGGGAGGGAVDTSNPDYNPNFAKTDAKGFEPSLVASRSSESCPTGGFTNKERDGSLIARMGTNKPLYKPQYWDTVKKLDQNGNLEDPAGNCMPPGVPRVGAPAEIIQTPKQVVFMYIAGGAAAYPAGFRAIPIDGRKHTNLEDLDGSWNGESIGHWEGDTLVIDSIGFNTGTWLAMEGYIHSENMHVVERLRRDGDTLTWQATVEDPDMLLQPWVMPLRTIRLNPDPAAILEESPPCSERDYPHAVTKEHH